MKNPTSSFVLICLVFLVFLSCDKDDCGELGISGEWTWIMSVGGIAGVTVTPETIGYDITLVIDDFTFKEFHGDTLAFESQYDLTIEPDSLFGTNRFIEFESGTSDKAIEISTSELIMYDLSFDGFVHEYRRH